MAKQWTWTGDLKVDGNVIIDGGSLSASGGGTVNATELNGITVTGTPSTGQVLTATSSSTADWAAGGGGGGTISGTITASHLVGASSSNTLSDVPGTVIDFTNGLITVQPIGTGVGFSVIGDANGSDIQDWYVNGSDTPIVSVTHNGLELTSIGVGVSALQPSGMSIQSSTTNAEVFMALANAPPAAGFLSMITSFTGADFTVSNPNFPTVGVYGDVYANNIQDWFVNSSGSPAVYIDASGNIGLPTAGLHDSTGSLGSMGDVLQSTGSQVLWSGGMSGSTTSGFFPYSISTNTLADSIFSYASACPNLNDESCFQAVDSGVASIQIGPLGLIAYGDDSYSTAGGYCQITANTLGCTGPGGAFSTIDMGSDSAQLYIGANGGFTGAVILADDLLGSATLTVDGTTLLIQNSLSNSAIGTGTTSNTDLAGIITLSSGTGIHNFAGTYVHPPICIVQDQTNVNGLLTVTVTNTSLTVTGSNPSDSIAYMCIVTT